MKVFIAFMGSFILALSLTAQPIPAQVYDDIKVLKISQKDQRAVIKIGHNNLRVVGLGDSIRKNSRIIEISQGRIVMEEITDMGKEIIIIRLENGKQRVERIKKAEEESKPFLVPLPAENKD
jgi:hypothetical protein